MSPTKDLVLERLVVLDSIVITLALMVFTVEILDCLVVEQTVCVNAARNLADCFRDYVKEECMDRQTVSRSFMVRRNRVRQRVRITLAATEEAEKTPRFNKISGTYHTQRRRRT
jgi:hypothetical protein